MRERRRFPRYEAALEVKYSTQGSAAIEGHSVTRNISRVGMRLPVSRIVKSGDLIDIAIKPNGTETPISALGRVVWARKIERPAPLELDAGVEFVKINSDDVTRLLQTSY